MVYDHDFLRTITIIMKNNEEKKIHDVMNYLKDFIRDLSKEDKLKFLENRWISVDDDLPEECKRVLVVGINYEGKKDIGFADFESSRGWSLPGNFNRIYFWSEYEIDIPDFEIKEEHNLWGSVGPDKDAVESLPLLSKKERYEKQYEDFHKEIGKDLIDFFRRLTDGEV